MWAVLMAQRLVGLMDAQIFETMALMVEKMVGRMVDFMVSYIKENEINISLAKEIS